MQQQQRHSVANRNAMRVLGSTCDGQTDGQTVDTSPSQRPRYASRLAAKMKRALK